MEESLYSMKVNGYKLELTYNSLGYCVVLHYGEETYVYCFDNIVSALNQMDSLIILFYD